MAKQRHLDHAPIIEALIDFRVQPADGISFETISKRVESQDFGYYVKGPITNAVVGFGFEADGSDPKTLESRASRIGVRMHSTDELYVAQLSIGGFTLSRLQPYTKWDDLLAESRRLWEIYVGMTAPGKVLRVATRFINNLNLPMRLGDSYQDYLERLADVPTQAPQAVSAFVQRFELVDPGDRANVVLTASLNMPAEHGKVPVILDIEAYAPINCAPNAQELWQALEGLHNVKNRTFFASITEKAAELYQ